MDRVTRGLLDGYVEAAGLGHLTDSQRFERFVAHIAISRSFGGSFSADDFCVGDGVQGIDTVAIIVNGTLMSDVTQLEEMVAEQPQIDAEFIFVQAKTSAKFEIGDLGNFADTVEGILNGEMDDVSPEASEMLDMLWKASEKIVENPVAKLYYITSGKWESPAALVRRVNKSKAALVDTNLVSRVDFFCWGAAEVQQQWRSIDRGLKTTIEFSNKATLPDIPQVTEAYLGVLPAEEYLKLVSDEEGEIRKSLFFDNVRDFQGDVDVNSDMRKTLGSEQRTSFCVLNNGITVVARSLTSTGNKFTLDDYQIVNGCQTSHVLHQERANLAGVYVPFRLIATSDDEVARSITTATNQQTQVSKESLLALGDEQKAIEQYFNTFNSDEIHRIYYERRSKQWAGPHQVKGAWRVISLRNLLQSYASIYLKTPHTAARYYTDLRDRAKAEVFVSKNHPAYFYSAAYAYCKLDQFFRNEQIDRRFKPVRYHLLAGVRAAFTGSATADVVESKEVKAEKALQKFNEFLWNDSRLLTAVQEVSAIVDDMADGDITRDFGRTRELTDVFLRRVLAEVVI